MINKASFIIKQELFRIVLLYNKFLISDHSELLMCLLDAAGLLHKIFQKNFYVVGRYVGNFKLPAK